MSILIFLHFLFSSYKPVQDRQTGGGQTDGQDALMRPTGWPHNKRQLMQQLGEKK